MGTPFLQPPLFAASLRGGFLYLLCLVGCFLLGVLPGLLAFFGSFRGPTFFEFPHVLEMIRSNEFDTIYHEHYSYLSVLALEPLFALITIGKVSEG